MTSTCSANSCDGEAAGPMSQMPQELLSSVENVLCNAHKPCLEYP